MSDTKTLGQKLYDVQMRANEATSELAFHTGEVERQAKRFADAMANPDFQQAVLALWSAFARAQRESGMGVEDFAKGLFATEVQALVVASEMRQHAAKAKAVADTGGGPPPAPCSCGAKEACGKCPGTQAPDVSPETLAYIKARAEDDANLMGVNSVARGEPKQDGIEKALGDLHRALLEKRADPSPLNVVLEVDRSSLLAIDREFGMRWPYLPMDGALGIGSGALLFNLPNGTILVREKK